MTTNQAGGILSRFQDCRSLVIHILVVYWKLFVASESDKFNFLHFCLVHKHMKNCFVAMVGMMMKGYIFGVKKSIYIAIGLGNCAPTLLIIPISLAPTSIDANVELWFPFFFL